MVMKSYWNNGTEKEPSSTENYQIIRFSQDLNCQSEQEIDYAQVQCGYKRLTYDGDHKQCKAETKEYQPD